MNRQLKMTIERYNADLDEYFMKNEMLQQRTKELEGIAAQGKIRGGDRGEAGRTIKVDESI